MGKRVPRLDTIDAFLFFHIKFDSELILEIQNTWVKIRHQYFVYTYYLPTEYNNFKLIPYSVSTLIADRYLPTAITNSVISPLLLFPNVKFNNL